MSRLQKLLWAAKRPIALDDGTTLEDYRRFVMEENYAGAHIDYAPVRGDWFVISGSIGDRGF